MVIQTEREKIPDLVRQARSGDGQAMEELLKAAHTHVSYQCRQFMKHTEDAEDMTQEVLIKIYNSLDSLDDPEKFISWANRIAARHCINQRQRNPKELQFAEDGEGSSLMDGLEESDEQKIPDSAIDRAETTRMIADMVNALPEAQRMCTYLFYYDEMSVSEIAEAMGVSGNTVKSRLNYARKSIRDGVLDYEKQGVKLYGMSPLPFLAYILHSAAESSADAGMASAMAKTVLGTAGAASGTAAGAAASGQSAAGALGAKGAGFFGTAAGKAAAAAAAGLVIAGGIVAVAMNLPDEEPEPTAVPASEHRLRSPGISNGSLGSCLYWSGSDLCLQCEIFNPNDVDICGIHFDTLMLDANLTTYDSADNIVLVSGPWVVDVDVVIPANSSVPYTAVIPSGIIVDRATIDLILAGAPTLLYGNSVTGSCKPVS